jgi:hypothetical protein
MRLTETDDVTNSNIHSLWETKQIKSSTTILKPENLN